MLVVRSGRCEAHEDDMARGVNKVILVGNLGNDPEMKYTQGGMAICTLSLATTTVRKDKDGNQQEKTEWHRVKLFGKLGEIAGEYLKKGRSAYIEGRIEYGSYEKDGVKHYTTDIIADEMQMLGGGDGQRGGGEGGGGYQRSGGGGDRPQRQPAQRRDPAPAKPANYDDVPFDDDIPF
jgi:single-strand DNA-binding protein